MYTIEDIIKAYEILIKGIEETAQQDDERSYGGIVRAGKGLLVESISKRLVEIAWNQLGAESHRLSFSSHKVKIPLNDTYLNKLKSKEVVNWIKTHINDFFFMAKVDVHVMIDNKFVLGIECKAYTENAMIKRILVDFTLLKQIYPEISCVLFQLESQLGGDYSSPSNQIIYGSPSTHTLISHFDVDLNIITLLEGERKVDKAIHKEEYYKDLKKENLIKAVENFKNILIRYV